MAKKNQEQLAAKSTSSQGAVEEVSSNLSQSTSEKQREKDPFDTVNTKYRNKLMHQVSDDTQTRRKVLELAIRDVEGISESEYQRKLRDRISNLLSNLYFVKDCLGLELNPFATAQNLVISGKKQTALVLKKGIKDRYKSLEEIKHELFTEEELAKAKYIFLTGQPAAGQLTELSDLIQAIKQIPGFENKLE